MAVSTVGLLSPHQDGELLFLEGVDDLVAVVLREVAVDAAHVELLHLEVLRQLVAVLLLGDEDEHGALGHEGDEARHQPLPLEPARPHHLHNLRREGGEEEEEWFVVKSTRGRAVALWACGKEDNGNWSL